MKKPTDFSLKVIKTVKSIPAGKVATYGQIAKLSGKEHAARGVSWILHACAKAYKLPWQRVLGSKGRISFHPSSQQYVRQMNLLKKEGVIFSFEGNINMDRFQWKKGTRK